MPKIKSFDRSVFQTLYFGYRPYLGRLAVVLSMGLAGRAALLFNANLIGHWVDSIEKSSRSYSNETYLSAILGLVLFGFIMTLAFRVLFSRISAQAVSRIYDETTFRASRFPMSFFDKTPVGRILTRFTSDYGNIFRLFGGPLAEFLSIIFDLIMMVCLLLLASPNFFPIIILMAISYGAIYRFNLPSLRMVRRELSASRSPSIAHFAETAQGASTISCFQKHDHFFMRFGILDDLFVKNKLNTSKTLTAFSMQMNFLSAFYLLATGIGVYLLRDDGFFTMGSIGIAFTFITMSSTTVMMFFEWLSQFEEAMVSLERLDRYLRKDIEVGSHLPRDAQFLTDHPQFKDRKKDFKPEGASCSIKFRNLWFRYQTDLPWVLKGLDFEIKAGECLGIIGRTGSGKSSLIQAIFNFYPIEKGFVSISNQIPNQDCDLHSYREHIAFISQDPTLFKGSLALNLDITETATEEELRSALTRVGLEHLGRNLNLQIEEKGKNLSLGERQLICLSRCLLRKTPVVIMDEATSSVDPQSEERMNQATYDFFHDRTRIIIAHRPTTIEKCDRILWLDSGEIRMIGTPSEVIAAFDLFDSNSQKNRL